MDWQPVDYPTELRPGKKYLSTYMYVRLGWMYVHVWLNWMHVCIGCINLYEQMCVCIGLVGWK